MQKVFIEGKYEIKKIFLFQLKYYKCFGWEPVHESLRETDGWEYEYEDRRLVLGRNDPNGVQYKFNRDYEQDLNSDEEGLRDGLRLITVKRNRKFASSDKISLAYSRYGEDVKRFNRLKKRYKNRWLRGIADLLLAVLCIIFAFLSLSLAAVKGGILSEILPSAIGNALLSFVGIAATSVSSLSVAFIGAGIIFLCLAAMFIAFLCSFYELKRRLLKQRDKVLTDLYNGYAAVKSLRLSDPTLQTAQERANLKQGQIYSAAYLHAKDLNNRLYI